MLRVVVVVAVLVVFVYGLVDVIRTDPRQTKGISKPAWIVVQIVIPVIGAILWFLIGRPRGTTAARPTYSHTLAPDDDPDFLRNLELRRRQQAEADRLKKLKDELDAKERKAGDSKGTPGNLGSESGEASGSGDAQGTDEVK